MGICSSCLGRASSPSDPERQRLLDGDPYSQNQSHPGHPYHWAQPPPPQANALSPEETRAEQEAMHNIMRWASDQIVEIFPVNPHMARPPPTPNSEMMKGSGYTNHESLASVTQSDDEDLSRSEMVAQREQQHQDILMSMIPGDKSKRSIRIYPASRPGTADAKSVRSRASQTRLASDGSGQGGKRRDGVFVKLDVGMP